MSYPLTSRYLLVVGLAVGTFSISVADEDRAAELIRTAAGRMDAGQWRNAREKLDLAFHISQDDGRKAGAAAWRGYASARMGIRKVADADFAEAFEYAGKAALKDGARAAVLAPVRGPTTRPGTTPRPP